MDNIKMIDLFSGTGAFSYVSSKYNIEPVFANDMIKSSNIIYDLNHVSEKSVFLLKDLNDVDVKTEIPKHDILCGGFPCQPFSIAGEKKGFEDPRSNVFWKILEIIKVHFPSIVILENVKNLKSHDEGNTYKTIEENIVKLGYFIKSNIIDTSQVTNIPQHRERIYIICFSDKSMYDKFDFNFNNSNKIIQPIESLLETNIDKKYYYSNKLKVYDEVKKNVVKHVKDNVLYQYRRYYIRENKSNLCPTLTANMGSGGHNVPLLLDDNGIRKLTPRECFNLQGFPKDYKLPLVSDSDLYKLAGNAVSIPVIDLIISKISDMLK